MFNWFNNLKIRSKLILAFIIIITLTIIISVTDLLSQHYIQTITTELLDVNEQIAKLSLKISNAMLMARRNEKDYLLRYKQLGFTKARAKYVTNVQAYIAKIHEYMDKIEKLEAHSEDLDIVAAIKQNLTKYESTFLTVIDLFEELGFQDIGLEGQVRNSVHTIENSIKINKLDQLTIDMLTMRRHEKDFLLRNQEKYVNHLDKTITNFKTNVAATSLNQTEKEKLIMQVNQYQTKFKQLVKINQQIAISIEIFRAAVHSLELPLEQMLANAIEQEKLARIRLQKITKLTFLTVISISLLVVIIGLLIAFFLANLFSKPLVFIAQGSKLLSEGNITLIGIDRTAITKLITRKDEIGEISQTFDALANYLQEVVKDIIQVSQGLAEGKQIIAKAQYQGDFIQIKTALETASSKLMQTTIVNNEQNWIKTGQANLNELIRGEQNITILAKNVIDFLCEYVEAQVGLFYLLQEDAEQPYLKIISTYAYAKNNERPDQYLIGEGLVGQVAFKQKTLYFKQEDAPTIISSSLANVTPHHILVLPCLYENELKAVLELGSFKELSAIQRTFLETVIPNIGIAINTANSRSQMQDLLEQSQQQSEELQTQQEKLQSSNEELQSQSEELQSQQEELRESNETLEERTKDLEQQKVAIQDKNQVLETTKLEMEKAQTAIALKAEELELASKYKSEFLANMSHELRTPLNSLLILSQLLTENKNGNLDGKQVEYAQTINSAGNDLLTLINDILDLSKVEAGKVEIQLENISLNNLLTSIKQKFIPIANDKGVQFNLIIADDIHPTLTTDSQRIKQIINNLLSNALKFTSEGEVKLTVQHPTELPANVDKLELAKTISISVTDSGIGIPKDKQQSIFEAFQQADGSTSRKYGGTGLGLSISRQLARLLGGELTLTSEPDKGSTFTLYLPKVHNNYIPKTNISTSEIHDESVSQENIKSSSPTPLLKKEYYSPEDILASDNRDNLSADDTTILLIEDDRKFSNILVDLAQGKGFKCLLAEDGLTGLKLIDEYKPDAIILDIGLPKLDGLTLMRKLKEQPSTRHIPVHFISADDQSIDAKKMGAIGYVVKPANVERLDEVFQKITTFLAKTVKNILIIANDELNRQKIMDLVADEGLQIEASSTGDNACQKLQTTTYDCVILDMNVEQGAGTKLLEMMLQKHTHFCKIPIIVYAERDLTIEEEELLLRCSAEIPIKQVNSTVYLVEETTLFLHQMEAKLPEDKQKILHMIHDKKAVLKNKKVLIVDDDERNIFALATILENQDVEVICAVNGKESLENLECNPDTAMILMDIMMPEMDGYEAIREIRKQEKYRNLPIIALTAKAMKDDKSKCIDAGANDYLTKPVDTDKLLSLMRVWLYR